MVPQSSFSVVSGLWLHDRHWTREPSGRRQRRARVPQEWRQRRPCSRGAATDPAATSATGLAPCQTVCRPGPVRDDGLRLPPQRKRPCPAASPQGHRQHKTQSIDITLLPDRAFEKAQLFRRHIFELSGKLAVQGGFAWLIGAGNAKVDQDSFGQIPAAKHHVVGRQVSMDDAQAVRSSKATGKPDSQLFCRVRRNGTVLRNIRGQ